MPQGSELDLLNVPSEIRALGGILLQELILIIIINLFNNYLLLYK